MVVGSIIGAVQGNKAAKTQANAISQAQATTQDLGNRALDMQEPFLARGDRAGQALEYELGLAERPVFTPEIEEQTNPYSITAIPGGPRYETRSDRDNDYQALVGYDVDRYAIGDEVFTTETAANNRLLELNREFEAQQAANAPQGFEYQGFQQTPGYQFQVDEMQKAVERSNAAKGMFNSGATAKELSRYQGGLANQEYNNYLNRLQSLAGAGQVAANQSSAITGNTANALSGLQVAQGNALAGGQAAIGQSAQSGFNNLVGAGAFLYGAGAFS